MFVIRKVDSSERKTIDCIVTIHINTFKNFFLTFMGRGFLNQMYRSYCEQEESGLLVAENDGRPVGFLAYSGNLSGLYKYMIKKRLIQFAWYSLGAFFRKPAVFMRIIRAFLKPHESKREVEYVELGSLGVSPDVKSKGIGSKLIEKLKNITDFNKYSYIKLETDSVNNDAAIYFYEKMDLF